MAYANCRLFCPNYHSKMNSVRVKHGAIGFEHQYFECRSCNHNENVVIALDSHNPNGVVWLSGAIKLPNAEMHNAVTHIMIEGRSIPHKAKASGKNEIIK